MSDLKITVDDGKILSEDDGENSPTSVRFHSEITVTEGAYRDETLTTNPDNMVNLSRTGSNPSCWFPVTNLQGHDWHSPKWFQQDEQKAAYIARIQADVEAACKRIESDWEAWHTGTTTKF
jgi:hypothetical protein